MDSQIKQHQQERESDAAAAKNSENAANRVGLGSEGGFDKVIRQPASSASAPQVLTPSVPTQVLRAAKDLGTTTRVVGCRLWYAPRIKGHGCRDKTYMW